MKKIGEWTEEDVGIWAYHAGAKWPLGLVRQSEIDDWLIWEARVIPEARWDPASPIRGMAPTLAGALRIVDVLLHETGTVSQVPEQATESAQRLLKQVGDDTIAVLIDDELEERPEITRFDVLRAIRELGRKAFRPKKDLGYPDPESKS